MSRGMRFILSFVVMAVFISVSGVALVYFLGSGGPTIETNSVWEYLVQLTDNLDVYSIFHQVIYRIQ